MPPPCWWPARLDRCARASIWPRRRSTAAPPARRSTGWSRSPTGRRLGMSDVLARDLRRQADRMSPPARQSGAAADAAPGRAARPNRRAASPGRFAARWTRRAAALIAEIKKASPSKGLDPRRFRPAGPRPGLRSRRRRLPVGADRRALFPGRDAFPDGGARRRAPAGLRKDFMLDP